MQYSKTSGSIWDVNKQIPVVRFTGDFPDLKSHLTPYSSAQPICTYSRPSCCQIS